MNLLRFTGKRLRWTVSPATIRMTMRAVPPPARPRPRWFPRPATPRTPKRAAARRPPPRTATSWSQPRRGALPRRPSPPYPTWPRRLRPPPARVCSCRASISHPTNRTSIGIVIKRLSSKCRPFRTPPYPRLRPPTTIHPPCPWWGPRLSTPPRIISTLITWSILTTVILITLITNTASAVSSPARCPSEFVKIIKFFIHSFIISASEQNQMQTETSALYYYHAISIHIRT